jgi:hypothetical protein
MSVDSATLTPALRSDDTRHKPAVDATDVVALANEMYPSHRLSVVDANTIGCPVGQATLIPIPKGAGIYAGLLAVDLPQGVTRGDRYDIVVRQLTKATASPQQPARNSRRGSSQSDARQRPRPPKHRSRGARHAARSKSPS